jgi:hypothetical protein
MPATHDPTGHPTADGAGAPTRRSGPGNASPVRVARARVLPVRTRLMVTITVDPAAWAREYGTGTDPVRVRGDVAAYLRTALAGARIWPALNVTVTAQEATP